MFDFETKQLIAKQVQDILQKIIDPELPVGEIKFILHVDGAGPDSWANIRNNGSAGSPEIPIDLIRNRSVSCF